MQECHPQLNIGRGLASAVAADRDGGREVSERRAAETPVQITDARALRHPAGRYEMLGEIGRGGVGIVYEGRDQDLGRDVAMKMLKD